MKILPHGRKSTNKCKRNEGIRNSPSDSFCIVLKLADKSLMTTEYLWSKNLSAKILISIKQFANFTAEKNWQTQS